MNRLEVVAKQITGAHVNNQKCGLAERGIRVIHVPLVLSLVKRKRLLMSVESAGADPTVTYIVFVGGRKQQQNNNNTNTQNSVTSVGGSAASSSSSSSLPSAPSPACSFTPLSSPYADYFCQGADETEYASCDVAAPLGTKGKRIQRAANLPRDEPFFQSPTISEVVEAIDACPKVTIAAISGQCLAEGAELILACDYRVATRSATISFDQIRTLGLIPCAGGTQRLPRAVGIQTAAHWITSGKNISATNALAKGLVDHVISSDNALFYGTHELLADAAVTQVVVASGSLNRSGVPKRRLSQTMGKIPFAVVANVLEAICRADMNAKMPKGFDAPSHALKAIMGYSSGDFKVGLANEKKEFLEVYDSAQSHAMRHLSMAKMRAAQGPAVGTMTNWNSNVSEACSDVAGGDGSGSAINAITGGENTIATIGIIGAGVMGSGIAACFLTAGFKVIVCDVDAERVAVCYKRLYAIFKPLLDRKRITQKQLDQRMANLVTVGGPKCYQSALREADIVIEAVFEDEALKRSIFTELDACLKPRCIIASNTASVDINRLAEVTKRPDRVVGIHFFSPAHIMQLVEIVKGASTSDETVLRLLSLTRRIHKIGVVVGNAFGFVSNRLAIRGVFQAVCLVEDGAFPYQVDGYIKHFGFANGVFEMQDMAGLDVASALLSVMPQDQKMARSVSTIPRELMAAGRLGMKTGKGWYQYDADEPTRPKSDITVERLCIATSNKKGIMRRTITQKEATYRFIFHIINEAALLLEQGVAVRPSDIDLIFVLGFGFPYFRGGPCYYADQIGIDHCIEKMQMFASTCGRSTFPAPCKFLVDMAKNKKRFSDFNQ